jgi:hypothetical protein
MAKAKAAYILAEIAACRCDVADRDVDRHAYIVACCAQPA